MPGLPSGTVTFLFTDIEGSTRLWDEHSDLMRLALARHDALLRAAIEQYDGQVFKTIGDAFCDAFHTAPDALNAALAAQQSLTAEPWPDPIRIKVRMALHTGAAEVRDNDYFGQPLNRIARLLSAGHGGQTLISAATQELIRDVLPAQAKLLSLGEHRLRDLSRPETVFQLLCPALPAEFPRLKSLDNPDLPNNLPRQLTSFVGREKEITEIKNLLTKTSLLTLTGSGGCGKTRLSLQVAADALDQYPDGVWLVELAGLSDPALVAQTVATALGLKEQTGTTFVQTLIDYLKPRRLLLVLDNCEHLLSASAQLCNVLLRACPQLSILVSSRESLGVAGEQSYRVPSLSLPDPKQPLTVGQVSQYEAVRLFIDRAVSSKADFTVTNASASALASVCHRLDGIPLAIELAAARVRSLSVEEINTKIDNRFRLLTGGSKTALPRQQTLRALIDWSYDLLTGQEKLLLCRLSVFAGGWTLAAAEAVCAGESVGSVSIEDWEALDLLTSLVDKSLVMAAEERAGATRYRLLETVRQYGRERLVENGESEQVSARHRDHFLALAEEAVPHLRGAEQAHWLAVLEAEHDNLRQALGFCLEEAEGAEAGLRLGAALWRFWYVHGHFSEGRVHLAAVLRREERPESLQVRAHTVIGAGVFVSEQGDYTAGCALLEEALAIYREVGDKEGIAFCLLHLGYMAIDQGDYGAARALLEESQAILRELGDQRGVAISLYHLGNAATDQDEYGAARALLEESQAILREAGDQRGIALSLLSLGIVASRQDDYGAARALLEESLAILRKVGDKGGIAGTFEAWGSLAHREQQAARAVRLWGAATALREAIGLPRPPAAQERYERGVAQAHAALGEVAFTTAFAEGRAMSLEQAIEYALGTE